MIDYVNRCQPMPLLLEVGLLCEEWHAVPADFGFAGDDPRVTRNVKMATGVYHALLARNQADKRGQWDRDNPGARKLLDWAGRYAIQDTPANTDMPQFPKRT